MSRRANIDLNGPYLMSSRLNLPAAARCRDNHHQSQSSLPMHLMLGDEMVYWEFTKKAHTRQPALFSSFVPCHLLSLVWSVMRRGPVLQNVYKLKIRWLGKSNMKKKTYLQGRAQMMSIIIWAPYCLSLFLPLPCHLIVSVFASSSILAGMAKVCHLWGLSSVTITSYV